MSSFTGVEFGPASCTLVRARRVEGGLELSAAHVIGASEWPSHAEAAASILKDVRRAQNFPRVARVVAWGLAEGAGPRDVATRAALRPLIAAGFRIDAVLSPARALAILASARPRPGGAASVWLAINRHGAAIAIVRGAELLYSRAFGWNSDAAAIGSQAHLLQRYSLVSHLAPEVRRGVELVRTKHDVAIEHAVTCGDLPDLRSLTMPLIEELDLEVETLDSVEGLILPPTARREHLPDSLAAVRLACAAAAGPVLHGLQVDVVRMARAAAVVAAIGSLGWIGYVWLMAPQPGGAALARPVPNGADKPVPSPVEGTSPAASRPASPPRAAPPASPRATAPLRREPPPRTVGAAPGSGRTGQSAAPAADTTQARPSRPAARTVPPPEIPPAPEPDSTGPVRAARAAPLKDPLPAIDTILVSSDRRLAVIDGAVVGIGDPVGPRTIVRIEVDAVYFREPSGLEIRVPMRMRR